MSNQDHNSKPPRSRISGANPVNRSVASSRGSDKRILTKKRFEDESDIPGLRLRSMTNVNKKVSTENSERSHYSIFEEMSLGGEVDPKNYDDRGKRRNRDRSSKRMQAN